MLTPEQIRKRALNRYEDFLRSLISHEAMFPLALFGSGMSQVADYEKARESIAVLRGQSKETKGFGYSVEWKQQVFRRYGEQQIPAGVSFLTREDFTRFLGKCSEACQFEKDYELLPQVFPELLEWARMSPLKLVDHAGEWSGLIKICSYLREQGRPNCYLRELPVEVDTKFIERKRGVLGELLPIVASSCVGPDASTFESRFGFRQKQPLIRFRSLDLRLVAPSQLPFHDFAVPLDEVNRLCITAENALVVENEMTFLTLPQIPRTIAILGSGDAVSHLRLISWLKQMRLLYWGDMDTHGFEALSFLRSHHQHAESIMMDVEAYTQFRQFAVQASAYASRAELHLSEVERALFNTLGDEGRLLEQERITLTYAKARLETVLGSIG
jgi:hypothetical protein